MLALDWSDELNVGISFMDSDHAEAAAMINGLAVLAGPDRVAPLEKFLIHCRDHFAREEAMMEATEFFARDRHRCEHNRALAEIELVLTQLRKGDAQDRYFSRTLPEWLMVHRNTMDFVTADFARAAGFDG